MGEGRKENHRVWSNITLSHGEGHRNYLIRRTRDNGMEVSPARVVGYFCSPFDRQLNIKGTLQTVLGRRELVRGASGDFDPSNLGEKTNPLVS